jgi:hypothetical protein
VVLLKVTRNFVIESAKSKEKKTSRIQLKTGKNNVSGPTKILAKIENFGSIVKITNWTNNFCIIFIYWGPKIGEI